MLSTDSVGKCHKANKIKTYSAIKRSKFQLWKTIILAFMLQKMILGPLC